MTTSRGVRSNRRSASHPRNQNLRFPDFVCVGAQKAGTSWLYANLFDHPDVWLSPVKELHYFDQLHVRTLEDGARDDERWRLRSQRAFARLTELRPPRADGSDEPFAALIASATVTDQWYGSIFALAPANSVCGEMTPSYALLPDEGIRHLVALNPAVKILFLARDPIDRAVAQLRMLLERRDRDPRTTLSPLHLLDIDPRFLKRSRYSETLRRYRHHIDEAALWIGDFDCLADNPQALLRSVCAFLGVRFDQRLFPHTGKKINAGEHRDIDAATQRRLREALAPEYDALAQLIPEPVSRWRARHYG